MIGNSVRVGRILGVELRLDYSWFVVFVLVAWMLAGHHFPMMSPGWTPATYWAVGVIVSVLFFASVVAHEQGTARSRARSACPCTTSRCSSSAARRD